MEESLPTDRFVTALRRRLGAEGVLDAPERIARFMVEQRGRYPGQGRVVARPRSTEEVADTVRLCQQHRVAIVPQSGNTGTVGGASPRHAGELLLSLERLHRIRQMDAEDGLLTAEAGCTLSDLQQTAEEAGWFLPLSLASEQQCRLGGNLATNAGGLNVLRYGMARRMTLGIEVVLSDGRVWSDLRGLSKDNSGYDLRDLFIGSEGTLGIITAATLRLAPQPRNRRVALIAMENVATALPLLRLAQSECGDAVSAAELMSQTALGMARLLPDTPENPLPTAPWYLLLELATPDPRADLDEALQAGLLQFQEAGAIRDAVVAPTGAAARRLWQLRTAIPEGQKRAGASIKHDISIRPGQIAAFIPAALAAVEQACPGARPCIFGHVGDGNLHFNVSQPETMSAETFDHHLDSLNRAVHDEVHRFAGSVAAEHGVGQLKRAEVLRYADPVHTELMRRIRQALDPEGLLNPGKGAT